MRLILVWIQLAVVASFAPSRLHATKTLVLSKSWDDDVQYASEWNSLIDDDDDDDDVDENIGLGLNFTFTDEERATIEKKVRERVGEMHDEAMDRMLRLKDKYDRDMVSSRRKAVAEFNEEMQATFDKHRKNTQYRVDKLLEASREQDEITRLAATADMAMQGKGRTLGSWGTINGVEVPMQLGSKQSAQTQKEGDGHILIIADESKDAIARELLPALVDKARKQDTRVEVIKPSGNVPLGGDDAACVVLFLPSLSTNPRSLLERLLRRTMRPGGRLAEPPTQFVAVSTLGTERTNTMPYAMQNMWGRPLDQRREAEETIVRTVQQEWNRSLDYTILKVGDIKRDEKTPFALMPGDVLDGTTALRTATDVLWQALTCQPAARNATLGVIGTMDHKYSPEEWDDVFLRLDELYRTDIELGDGVLARERIGALGEYVSEWAKTLAQNGKLITPVLWERSPPYPADLSVKLRVGVKLIFQTTRTGSNYMSRDEERERERETGNKTPQNTALRQKPEGGVEILVETTHTDGLRVRARRCNMGPNTVVKEQSEESILRRLRQVLASWDQGDTT